MKRTLFIGLVFLFITGHQLPAPITEESSTPAPEESAKPKPKRTIEPKAERTATTTSTPVRSKKFAGAWTGIMKTFPAGNQTTQIVIDSTETTMRVSWFGKMDSAKAQVNGDTLQATFPPPAFQPESHRWAITPQPDGVSARVHFQCFLNDFTATFHRAGSSSGKTAR